MDWIRIRWEKVTRYYEVYLHQNLWGEWVLTRTGLGTARIRLGKVIIPKSDVLALPEY